MHKAFTRHCLSDAIKNLGVEVKTYARTARDNAYIVARGFAPRTSFAAKALILNGFNLRTASKDKQGSAETESRPNKNVDWMWPFTATRDRVRSCGLGLFRFHLLPLSTCPAIKV